jgi:metal-dependent amidase/aminoacylase/carboxypeptidase family protein
MFGAAADHALKSVGVCINQTREESAVLEANSALDFTVRSETQDATNLVANKGEVALKAAARVN